MAQQQQTTVPPDFVPRTPDELRAALADPMWRIGSGQLYRIIVKSSDSYDGQTVVPFRPNAVQQRLIRGLWYRNVIPKARQLGITTLVALLWLDHALFNPDQRCGIVAHKEQDAQIIFRDKIKFAYDNLPEELRKIMPLAKASADELLFAHNNSSIRVSTSMRSGTIHRLHISEFGKLCAKFPDRANEVITGSLQAVPLDGITIVESTAEGASGHFYEMCQRAKALAEQGKPLTPRDYRLHFFAWHDSPEYAMDPAGVAISPKDHEYFDTLEAGVGKKITPQQRAWYVATRDSDFAGDPEKMWQEYPSTVSEAFQVSTEGTYYAVQLARARAEGRIGRVPHVSGVPVNTFWDIGSSDGTAIWFHQKVGAEHRFIRFYEAWGEPYEHFIRYMQSLGWIWGTHYLPHDAGHERMGLLDNRSPVAQLRAACPGWRFEVVPRVAEVQHGIQMVRDVFSQCWFDEEGCKEGLAHLALYRREWNDRTGTWRDRPRHDEHSEAADAFRQFAQGWSEPAVRAGSRPRRRRVGGLVV